jgi:hypothetical protein
MVSEPDVKTPYRPAPMTANRTAKLQKRDSVESCSIRIWGIVRMGGDASETEMTGFLLLMRGFQFSDRPGLNL